MTLENYMPRHQRFISGGNLAESVVKCDAVGNLTEDGTWQYPYDGENRLTKMINKSNNAYTLTFAYDYLGRRIRKTVANGQSDGVNVTPWDRLQSVYKNSPGIGVSDTEYLKAAVMAGFNQ